MINDWNLFWNAFGAIGTTVGSIATAVAVIVALWQTKFNEKKKLRINFSDSYVVYSPHQHTKVDVICLNVVNVGNRTVILDNWGFRYSNKKESGLIGFNQSILESVYSPKLPHDLPIEATVTLFWEKVFFERAIAEEISCGHLKSNKRVVFFVTDSTGKIYTTKTSKAAKYYCHT